MPVTRTSDNRDPESDGPQARPHHVGRERRSSGQAQARKREENEHRERIEEKRMSVEKGRKSRENENPASCRNRSAPARLSAPETRSPRNPAAGRRRPARRRRRLAAAAAPAEDRGRLPCVSRPSSSPPQHNQTEADGVGTGLCSVGRRHTRAPPRADRPRAALTTVTPAPNRPIKIQEA